MPPEGRRRLWLINWLIDWLIDSSEEVRFRIIFSLQIFKTNRACTKWHHSFHPSFTISVWICGKLETGDQPTIWRAFLFNSRSQEAQQVPLLLQFCFPTLISQFDKATIRIAYRAYFLIVFCCWKNCPVHRRPKPPQFVDFRVRFGSKWIFCFPVHEFFILLLRPYISVLLCNTKTHDLPVLLTLTLLAQKGWSFGFNRRNVNVLDI